MSARTDNTSRRRTLQRERLSELLIRRDQAGMAWAEGFSHARPGVGRLTIDLMVAEASLADGWPHLAENWTGEWAVADIRKLHDPAAGPKAGCSICARRIARASPRRRACAGAARGRDSRSLRCKADAAR